MRQHGAVSRYCLGLFLAIASDLALIDAVAEDQPPGETETQSSLYTYHDDWAIVSAPPPPGPYQAVNVDPRIPGQEDVRTPFVSGFNAPPALGEQLPDDFMGAPPAAGTPTPTVPGTYSRQESYGHEPPPGYYRSRGDNRSWTAPVQDYPGYYGYPRSGYSRYGNAPSPWNNPPVQRTEDEVPPPPVYNPMAAPPSPGYRGMPVPPDQFYRRGIGTQ